MELRNIKSFIKVAEFENFSKAAEVLGYAQSTITLQIQQLEQELAVKLFEKIGRKMVVTRAGKELLPYIETVLDTVAAIGNYAKKTQGLTGELTVAMPESLLTYRMQKILRLFREQAPQVRLSLQMQNCFDIREAIVSGSSDFGVHYDVGGYNDNIFQEKLAEFELTLVCSPAVPMQDRDFISSHQRKKLCLLTDDCKSIFFVMFAQYLSAKDIVMDNIVELNSIEAIKRSVASNLGVAVLPRFTVAAELEAGVLQEMTTAMPVTKITAVFAHHKNKWVSPAMERFIALLRDNI
mgnify:CR=1 FL=1